MGLLDGPFASVIAALSGSLFADAVLYRVDDNYLPVEGTSAPAKTSWSVKISPPEDLKINEAYDTFRASGTTVQKGDFKTILDPNATDAGDVAVVVEPKVDDRLQWQGFDYRVKQVTRVIPTSETVAYELVCGR